MALSKYINVMISSRNSSNFDGTNLTEIRKEIKDIIEKEKLFGREIFKVWINEEEDPQSFDETIWKKCLREARQADIVISLYNGQSGWIKENDSIGICHDELREALDSGSGKVWAIKLEGCVYNSKTSEQQKNADKKFKEFVEKNHQIFSKPVSNIKLLKKSIKEILNDAVIKLVERGVFEVSRSKSNYGEVLSWKRMNYVDRSNEIVKALEDSIDKKETGFLEDKTYFLQRNNYKVLLILHAIPDSVSIASARERVGQPFLQDFRKNKQLLKDDNTIGPVHIIGCHKTVTETQARNILGFPDAIILKDSFGIYVADNIQKIQMVFLEKCSDSYSTAHAFQEFIDWMIRTNEMEELEKRATSRKNIIETIANEN